MINNQHSIHSFSYGAFIWWQGVVEDINDPEQLGRVRVRIIGYHTDDKTLIPTNTLPWSSVSLDVTTGGTSELGKSPVGIKNGAHVWGFFRDGHNAQDPIVVGVLIGIPSTKTPTNIGFSDPSGKFPLSDRLGEPDSSRLSRGNTSDTAIENKNNSLIDSITSVNESWSEPKSPYNAQYPHNSVNQTESGHVIEVDDTPGAERLHNYHKSGTFDEIHPDGTKVTKVVMDNYTLILGNDNVLVEGSVNITINSNANIDVNGDINIKNSGDVNLDVGRNLSVKSNGKADFESNGPMSFKAPRIDIN